MKRIVKLLWLALFGCGFAFGDNLQMFFATCGNELCMSTTDIAQVRYTANRTPLPSPVASSVRTMILNSVKDASAVYRTRINRPVFILDGIYLSTDEVRTVEDLYSDVEEFGIPEMLVNMGYTPILVQFSETVSRSVRDNSELFAKVLSFFSSNVFVSFPNAVNDGVVVLGISQGGIIGRKYV